MPWPRRGSLRRARPATGQDFLLPQPGQLLVAVAGIELIRWGGRGEGRHDVRMLSAYESPVPDWPGPLVALADDRVDVSFAFDQKTGETCTAGIDVTLGEGARRPEVLRRS